MQKNRGWAAALSNPWDGLPGVVARAWLPERKLCGRAAYFSSPGASRPKEGRRRASRRRCSSRGACWQQRLRDCDGRGVSTIASPWPPAPRMGEACSLRRRRRDNRKDAGADARGCRTDAHRRQRPLRPRRDHARRASPVSPNAGLRLELEPLFIVLVESGAGHARGGDATDGGIAPTQRPSSETGERRVQVWRTLYPP